MSAAFKRLWLSCIHTGSSEIFPQADQGAYKVIVPIPVKISFLV
jgi:hypothetical protein